ncbi:MAG: RNA polymerase-binding protein DksA [Desulfovibrionaceae bacterium]|nr:RNA polymerase-binding protein DksA [Desulfovibrionaceae bacterium]
MDQANLDYFKEVLAKMLAEAQQKGDSTLEDLTDNNEMFADPADRATMESDRAFTLRIRDRERKLIKKIQAATQRMENGTFGICEECGEEISIARLKARPVTRLCINCKSKQEEDEGLRGE